MVFGLGDKKEKDKQEYRNPKTGLTLNT